MTLICHLYEKVCHAILWQVKVSIFRTERSGLKKFYFEDFWYQTRFRVFASVWYIMWISLETFDILLKLKMWSTKNVRPTLFIVVSHESWTESLSVYQMPAPAEFVANFQVCSIWKLPTTRLEWCSKEILLKCRPRPENVKIHLSMYLLDLQEKLIYPRKGTFKHVCVVIWVYSV